MTYRLLGRSAVISDHHARLTAASTVAVGKLEVSAMETAVPELAPTTNPTINFPKPASVAGMGTSKGDVGSDKALSCPPMCPPGMAGHNGVVAAPA